MKEKGQPAHIDCPLSFPSFSVVNHGTTCPIYSELVNTELDASTLHTDQLDQLKGELDILYRSVSDRITTLTGELQLLGDWMESKKTDKSQVQEEIGEVASPGAGRCLRDMPNRSENCSPAPSRARNKQAKLQSAVIESLGRLPKSDAPEKFWAIVEPYCADVTEEDLKTLEDLMRSHDDDLEYYKIPSLGKHYLQKWLSEDMDQDKKDELKLLERKKAVAGQKRRLDSVGEGSSSSVEDFGVQPLRDEAGVGPFGPLTQRLVSALIEENIISPANGTILESLSISVLDNNIKGEADGYNDISSENLVKQLNISNTSQLEKRIKKELEEQGILTPDEVLESDEGDEILAELKQKQQELKIICQSNLGLTKRLYRLAKEEMTKQDLKRKLAAVDADVMEAYQRVQQARQKKRVATKREKDAVMKALKERDALVKQIESSSLT